METDIPSQIFIYYKNVLLVSRSAVTKYHKLCDLNKVNLLSQLKSKIRMLDLKTLKEGYLLVFTFCLLFMSLHSVFSLCLSLYQSSPLILGESFNTGSYYETHAGLELMILLPLSPKCWDYQCALLHLASQFPFW
jgi:hypothetical protein